MTEPYTNADLDAAENGLVALGRDGEAAALRQYTQGIRNLVQGEWGQSFLTSLERLSERQSAAIVDAVRGELGALRVEVGALGTQFHEEINALNRRMADSEADRQMLHAEIAALRASFEEYKAGNRRAEFDDLRRDVDHLKQAHIDGNA